MITVLRAAQFMAYANLRFQYEEAEGMNKGYGLSHGIRLPEDPSFYFSEDAKAARREDGPSAVERAFYRRNQDEIDAVYGLITKTGNKLIGREVNARSAVATTPSLTRMFGFNVCIQPAYCSPLIFPVSQRPISVRLTRHAKRGTLEITGFGTHSDCTPEFY